MCGRIGGICLLAACFTSLLPALYSEVLTPPYFNLALRRPIVATATCGVGTADPELYCKLVGAGHVGEVIGGQGCDYCNPNVPEQRHPPEYAVDGTETWWQSPPLSRGMKYNEVNLTIDLGQEFHVAYVIINMGNSPRPGVWVLERSNDNGETYHPWQYFADDEAQCILNFGPDSVRPIERDDSVICETGSSAVVPLENGEIYIPLVTKRPSAENFFNSTVLQEWTRATNVRIRLIRTKTLGAHLMSLVQQDPTVTRRYFYSIRDISIGGRCRCNGHAVTCDIIDPDDTYKLICRCKHNTCGHNCEICCPGFEQKAWSQSKNMNETFVCEPCNCFGHSEQCKYNATVDRLKLSLDIHGVIAGGGVCENCRDNTEGINCNKCVAKFYRPHGKYWNETDVCQACNCETFFHTGNCEEGSGRCECKPEYNPPNCDSCSFGHFGYPECKPCECHLNGTEGFQCESIRGFCKCKPNYSGQYCNQCAEGFYNFPECSPCECNITGAQIDICDSKTGDCPCRNSFGGRACDQCHDGFFNFPGCNYCNCDFTGTIAEICDKSNGKCLCKEGYGGDRCDRCSFGYSGYPSCKPCGCSQVGSVSSGCDSFGKCSCLYNFAGKTCEACSPGYYNYPECLPCDCAPSGSLGHTCNNTGQCFCKPHIEGIHCDKCNAGLYNFPLCEECSCHPAGTTTSFAGCGSLPLGSLCECKTRVQGRICNECRDLFWNLQTQNPDGCEDCFCHTPGVLGGIGSCDTKSGQCVCKPSVTSRRCDECNDGYYNLQESNLLGCSECGCDIGGSIKPQCDKQTGQCHCQARVTGRTCKEPLQAHYFPTLHQFKFEAEDALSQSNTPLRYDFNSTVFPNFSWRGYAIFSILQDTIISSVSIEKSSIYRMILRYINPSDDSIPVTVKVTPEFPNNFASEQIHKVLVKPSRWPSFTTLTGISDGIPTIFVMDPGPWSVSIKSPNILLLDYFVLLPSDYYEANLLEDKVLSPCVSGKESFCRHFQYLSTNGFDVVVGVAGFTSKDGITRQPVTEFFDETEHIDDPGLKSIPLLNDAQSEIHLDLRITRPGPHVLILNYVTPEDSSRKPSKLFMEASSQNKQFFGILLISECRYTTLCRQVVLDRNHSVSIFDFDTNNIRISLKADDPNTILGVESVTAIPLDQWSLDFIELKSVCVRKDGKCIASLFQSPPDTTKIQFATNNAERVATEMPPEIFDNATKLVYLTPNDVMIDVRATVQNPGPHSFVVHFYQPNFSQFSMDVIIQNGQYYEAKLLVPHCPSNSGCRAIIKQSNGNTQFQLTENVVLTLKVPNGKTIWLDYALIVPVHKYSENIVAEDPVDLSGLFISQCGQNHFFIDENSSDFCRKAVFSLATFYNNGAQDCMCNIEGSLDFECEKFGGQCKCKPNIIGRSCKICETGYFGFPNCKPCDCPAKLCEPNTGTCVCPPNVIGQKCTECKEYTYGYDLVVGCLDCACNELGVKNGNLQCDLLNGNCECKSNVVGRACDECEDGYWSFPHCGKCDCDFRGTIPEVCDQSNGYCSCKKNVFSLACDLCKEGTFNLQENNEDGCTKCFCFGKTTRCKSSDLYRTTIQGMDGWMFVLLDVTKTVNVKPFSVLPQKIEDEKTNAIGTDFSVFGENVIYFSAPEQYLGNRLTSYGGDLNFTLLYTTGYFGNAISGPDVVLYGAGIYLLHFSLRQPASSVPFDASVTISEKNFIVPSGLPASREQLMQVLEDLEAIYIRAIYQEQSVTTRLKNVSLDSATIEEFEGANLALSVEQCTCPPNYIGLSCEECADGYYRSSHSSLGDFCIPCQCNGHTNTCDKVTGICIDCKNNTVGDHCEQCASGYHGNATNGFPNDCFICACPLPMESNNFATSCEVTEDGEHISCNCIPGYSGARCESCSAGYYGMPESAGDFCKPCKCSGNIDPSDPRSCDSETGECTDCLYNTFGESCQYCAPGYFGDAVGLKNCQTCDCHTCGIEKCNHSSGACICLPNVIGDKCDRCADKHFGFASCNGCTACNCSVASEKLECEDSSGQCKCKPGVTGRTCDHCIAGYWNYSFAGCTSCGCNSEYSLGVGCNPETGQCVCLPNVIGAKCDSCPHRWVFIPDEGCEKCDTCTDALLDTTDSLSLQIVPVVEEFKTVAKGYFTTQRLIYINDTVENLKKNVTSNNSAKVDISPISESVEYFEKETRTLYEKSELLFEKGIEEVNKSGSLLSTTNEVESLIGRAVNQSGAIVSEIKILAFNLAESTGPQIDIALREAQSILNSLDNSEIDREQIEAVYVNSEKASSLYDNMTNFRLPVNNHSEILVRLREKIEIFDDKLNDLQQHRNSTNTIVKETMRLNNQNRNAKLVNKTNILNSLTEEASSAMKIVRESLNNASSLNNKAEEALSDLTKGLPARKILLNKLNETALNRQKELHDVHGEVEAAQTHARNLGNQAKELDSLLSDTRSLSDNAVSAANAYKNIISRVNGSFEAAKQASDVADKVESIMTGLNERSSKTENSSTVLLQSAQSLLAEALALNPNLNVAQGNVEKVALLNNKSVNLFNKIDNDFSQIPNTSPDDQLNDIIMNANTAEGKAGKVLESIKSIGEELPLKMNSTKPMAKDISDINSSVTQANVQLDSFSTILLNVSSLMNKLRSKPEKLKAQDDLLRTSLNELKKMIASARDILEGIKVGVTLFEDSALELRNPDNLAQQGISSNISLYFKTAEKNGLLLFVGNEVGTSRRMKRSSTDDFLMLQIEGGYPKLTINLGSGSEPILVDKYVSDNIWYKAVIERTGTTARLKIIDEKNSKSPAVKELVLPGPMAVLNLDKDLSHIFVGSIAEFFKSPESTPVYPFRGEIQDLMIGKTPLSLWNFIKIEHVRGSVDRDQLIQESLSTGCRLNGDGYVKLDSKKYTLKSQSDIIFKFKTKQKEGLLFLAFKDNTFLSIELRDGKILFQFKIDEEPVKIFSHRTFNDDQFHYVEAVRMNKLGALKVDNQSFGQASATRNGNGLQVSEYIYIGGYTGEHKLPDVTNMGFDGCIDDVQILSISVKLNENIVHEALPGCPEEAVNIASFDSGTQGYMSIPSITVTDNSFQLILRLNATYPNGLVLFATDGTENIISLRMDNGDLIFKSGKLELSTSSLTRYDDNLWHVVSASHTNGFLQLIIDDFDVFNSSRTEQPSNVRLLNGNLYFGSVPSSVDASSVGPVTSFSGCISDVTINGDIINFAKASKTPDVVLGKCVGHGDRSYLPSKGNQPAKYDDDEDMDNLPPTQPVTTPTPATLPTQPPTPAGLCSLPISPLADPDITPESGLRFGNVKNSRMEYSISLGKIKKQSDLYIEFKTISQFGIIFYASNDKHTESLAVYSFEGKIRCVFGNSSELAFMESSSAYNNGEWHTLKFKREGLTGELTIDDKFVSTVTGGSLKVINFVDLAYIGGLDPVIEDKIKVISKDSLKSFEGCLRNFKLNGKSPKKTPKMFNAIPCSDKVEKGTFFSVDGGYVKLYDKFTVGSEMDLKFDFKPRNVSGLLLGVFGKKDFLALQMVDGKIKFSVENGNGVISTYFVPPEPYNFCNGEWHTIQALKTKNVVSLNVNNVFAEPGIGPGGSHTADTKHPLYLGGHPDIEKLYATNRVDTKLPFVGCIRNIEVNTKQQEVSVEKAFGSVSVGVCSKI